MEDTKLQRPVMFRESVSNPRLLVESQTAWCLLQMVVSFLCQPTRAYITQDLAECKKWH